MQRGLFVYLLLLALSLFLPQSSPGQDAAPKPSQFLKSVGSALAARDYDKALSLIHAADAEPDEVPQALWRVAYVRFHDKENVETLELLQEIVEKYPDAEIASRAWLRMAQVYARLKDDEKMIAALEHGSGAKRAHNGAAEVIGQYLVQAGKWEKALAAYTDWKPSSHCGNCLRSMESSRLACIALCQAQLGKPVEAAQTAWQNRGDPFAMLSLIRLYSDAGQLHDLQKMLVSKDKDKDKDKDIERALELAVSTKWTDHLREFEMIRDDKYAEYEFTLAQHVASWRLLQNAGSSTAAIISEAQEQPISHYTKLLAAIDTAECRNVLVDLAAVADDEQQWYVGHVIQARCEEPKELLWRVQQTGTVKRRFWNSEVYPTPTTHPFYTSWPAVRRGSLPKQLAVDGEAEK
jgi:tetratricopeptide (TPR) repeat protein